MRLLLPYLLVILSVFFEPQVCKAQSFGLQFASSEVVQEARTGLNLIVGEPISFSQDFNISFDLAFCRDQDEYFGYILRLVTEKNEHIDLIYDNNPQTKNHLKLVVEEKDVEFPYPFDKGTYFEKWAKIVLIYSVRNNCLTLKVGKQSHVIHLKRPLNLFWKVLFGANEIPTVKTTDVPPMQLRDVEVAKDLKLTYKWPLNEQGGSAVAEIITGKEGSVSNPIWVRQMHTNWTSIKQFNLKGPASVAFDANNDVIYIIGRDSLYSLAGKKKFSTALPYRSGPFNLMRGNQSYYESGSDRLYNIYIDQATFSVFNFQDRSWDKAAKPVNRLTDFWHFNKYFSPVEHVFYLFGGYGHFSYKGMIRRYDPVSKTLSIIKPSAGSYVPRYLAALGGTENGAYILGGYGSPTGKQILNPRALYDLLYFDVRTKSIRKIYEFNNTAEDMVFANSLIVDEKNDTYYGLVYPNTTFKSRLRLVRGSLSKARWTSLANEIPYSFQDTKSFSDLFYSKKSRRFFAVTIFTDEADISTVSIYSLAAPPLAAEQVQSKAGRRISVIAILIGISAVILLVAYSVFKNRKRLDKKHAAGIIESAELTTVNAEDTALTEPGMPIEFEAAPIEHLDFKPYKNVSAIYLFGDFQMFDNEGNDITRHFTPLVRELFLVVLLYTFQWDTGISSDKLKELLWSDKSSDSARNNRAVNIAKLKSILSRIPGCEISRESGTWQILTDSTKVRVDYYDYLMLVRNKKGVDKKKIEQLAEITKRGNILSTSDYEWLDAIKSDISNEIIDTYLHYANATPVANDPEFLVKLAGYIFKIDSVNEEAMVLKCKALVHLGKHSLAKTTFGTFCREYRLIYDVDFNRDFQQILE